MSGRNLRRMYSILGMFAYTMISPESNNFFIIDPRSQEEIARIDRLAEEIGSIQGLKNSFQPILTTILVALDAPPIFMRTKALRALGQIVTSDATILATVCCPPCDQTNL